MAEVAGKRPQMLDGYRRGWGSISSNLVHLLRMWKVCRQVESSKAWGLTRVSRRRAVSTKEK